MTIYLVEWEELKNDGTEGTVKKHHAMSSYVKAQKHITMLEKANRSGVLQNVIIENIPGEKIQAWRPKGQADVILMINALSK
jgi:hypothetical protein